MEQIRINDFDRKCMLNLYRNNDMPFVSVTTNVDVTNAYKISKKKHVSFYAVMNYCVARAASRTKEFCYRLKDNTVCSYKSVKVAPVVRYEGELAFITLDNYVRLSDYVLNYKKQVELLSENYALENDEDLACVWTTCLPWFKASHVMFPYNKDNTIPQFCWDKYEKKYFKTTLNLTIFAYHGFVDGYAISEFLTAFNVEMKNLYKNY